MKKKIREYSRGTSTRYILYTSKSINFAYTKTDRLDAKTEYGENFHLSRINSGKNHLVVGRSARTQKKICHLLFFCCWLPADSRFMDGP